MSRRIESLMIPGPAGRLEALLEEPEKGAPAQAALVCHPHPLHGGTMHNKVVHRMARGLRRAGAVVLRFNFRGVNRSEGEHDKGRGETEDARAALAVLRERYPDLPFSLAGFSFGSRVCIRLAFQLAGPAPRRLLIAGYPTVYKQHDLLTRLSVPRLFIHSTEDEFGPQAELQALYDRLWEPKQLHWIDAKDHFFAGSLDVFELKIADLAR
ncbi:MAG: alpha/beta fold hydrolase [Bryobacteraceae bacterium]|nr:alpha/beta fold hydrolase [Bryobacteraceae bacterium]